MNKNAIQKYAIWARNELIEQVKQRAYQYGISDKDYGEENADIISGRVLTADEKRQRTAFVREIQKRGYQEAVEEVAYTWFNRFVALRFMEVNDYLPTHVRVFSDATGDFNPEILRDVLHLDLDGLDKAKVSELLNANKTDELYRYLLLTQCNALNAALPEIFEKLGGYTEMLLPNNILKQDSILARLVKDIDEDDWKDAVQIIGWMYQYYITELNEIVYDGTFSKKRIPKELLSAATTIYTPDWAIRYLVDNSLGRLWLEGHPDIKLDLKYYIDEAEQVPEVAAKLELIRKEYRNLIPEDIKIIDPCMGSGHILVYAFDVLMQIYRSMGYSDRNAASLILEKNLFGLDIDRRAYQLAYFSLMMKARQYNRRIFAENVKPQVYHPTGFSDGEELGSIMIINDPGKKPEPKVGQMDFFTEDDATALRIWNFKRLLSQKYDVVVTNPPYLGAGRFSPKLSDYVVANYADVKSDLSMVMYKHALADLSKRNGFVAFITTTSWMFLSSFERLRSYVLSGFDFDSLVDFGTELFEGKVGHNPIVAWINRNCRTHKNMVAIRLVNYCYSRRDEKETEFFNLANRHTPNTDNFHKIPRSPVAYWVGAAMLRTFEHTKLSEIGSSSKGIITGDNSRFLRLWTEVSYKDINFCATNPHEAKISPIKWYPCRKGGAARRWFGNNDYVINWKHDGFEVIDCAQTESRNCQDYAAEYKFRPSVSWTSISSGMPTFRFGENDLAESAGMSYFVGIDKLLYVIGYLNTNVAFSLLLILSPTMNYTAGAINGLPIVIQDDMVTTVNSIVNENISNSRTDWDAFETSWGFKRHPHIVGKNVAAAFDAWKRECEERFQNLKRNEEELNRIFIGIYGLQDELTPEIEDKDVTVRHADLGRDIRSFISYAVGCMFGRYSLDTDRLAYAGGDWDSAKYKSFVPDKDNILPICDDDYFDDDILGRFVDFVRVVYGSETLEENLKFIADALGGKGTPREVIRNYFLNYFYTDHCKIYQKRPIYWLFDSGKKNGFKALIYMHRYSRDLLAKLRTDYVHEQQERYRTQLSNIDAGLNTATGSDRARLLKQQDKLTEQLKEITAFEEKIHHLADQNIEIDLDDGVKKNYKIFAGVLAKI